VLANRVGQCCEHAAGPRGGASKRDGFSARRSRWSLANSAADVDGEHAAVADKRHVGILVHLGIDLCCLESSGPARVKEVPRSGPSRFGLHAWSLTSNRDSLGSYRRLKRRAPTS